MQTQKWPARRPGHPLSKLGHIRPSWPPYQGKDGQHGQCRPTWPRGPRWPGCPTMSRRYLEKAARCRGPRERQQLASGVISTSATSVGGRRKPMRTQATDRPIDRDRNLTRPAALDRLLSMMVLWWQGRSLADIGRAYGISRQRVAAILGRVGCTRALWRMADHERPDSKRRGWRHGVKKARAALLHPLAHRLTIRQRAALAWQALGPALPDIACRMRATSQNVRSLQVAAYWRLERLSRREEPTEDVDIAPIDWTVVGRGAETDRFSDRTNASVTEALVEKA